MALELLTGAPTFPRDRTELTLEQMVCRAGVAAAAPAAVQLRAPLTARVHR